MEPAHWSIGQLARAAGTSVGALRFYERRGLLARPVRTASGHRRYPQETLGRLRVVKRAQELGFTLAEIAGLLDLASDAEASCRDVCEAVQARLDHVERQIAGLREQRGRLRQLRAACPRTRPLRECPVFVDLEQEPRPQKRRKR